MAQDASGKSALGCCRRGGGMSDALRLTLAPLSRRSGPSFQLQTQLRVASFLISGGQAAQCGSSAPENAMFNRDFALVGEVPFLAGSYLS